MPVSSNVIRQLTNNCKTRDHLRLMPKLPRAMCVYPIMRELVEVFDRSFCFMNDRPQLFQHIWFHRLPETALVSFE